MRRGSGPDNQLTKVACARGVAHRARPWDKLVHMLRRGSVTVVGDTVDSVAAVASLGAASLPGTPVAFSISSRVKVGSDALTYQLAPRATSRFVIVSRSLLHRSPRPNAAQLATCSSSSARPATSRSVAAPLRARARARMAARRTALWGCSVSSCVILFISRVFSMRSRRFRESSTRNCSWDAAAVVASIRTRAATWLADATAFFSAFVCCGACEVGELVQLAPAISVVVTIASDHKQRRVAFAKPARHPRHPRPLKQRRADP